MSDTIKDACWDFSFTPKAKEMIGDREITIPSNWVIKTANYPLPGDKIKLRAGDMTLGFTVQYREYSCPEEGGSLVTIVCGWGMEHIDLC